MTLRSVLIALLLFIAISIPASAQPGLVAHWPFNGNATDASGNGYNGTPTNVTYTTGSGGLPNTAALFNGFSSYIDVAYQSGLNVSNMSICAVVKANGWYTGLCQANVVVWRGSQFQSGHYGLHFMDNAYDNGNCTYIDTSKNVFVPSVQNTTGVNGVLDLLYTPTMISQKWYCVVMTYNGTQSRIYIDGVLKSVFNIASGTLGTSTQGISIGANRFANASTFPYWLNGAIDDLRIFNRVLTENEIVSYCGTLVDTNVFINQLFSDTAYCSNDTFRLNYGTTYPFQSGNTFTAQLSNASGSFASPVTIGSVSATTSGSILCTVPTSITNGTGYRVRIVATNPVRTSNDTLKKMRLTGPFNITASSNGSLCEGNSILLNATSSTSGITYSWTGPNSFTSGIAAPTIVNSTVVNSGDYYATGKLYNCFSKDTVTVLVKPTPVKPVVGSNSPACTKSDINLTANSTGGASYSWTGPGGYTSTAQNPVRNNVSTSMAGYYKVFATLNGCNSLPDSTQVSVVKGPEIGAIPSPGNAICVGDSITFLGFATNPPSGSTYQWMKNGNPIAGANSLKYTAGGLADGDVIYLTMTPGPGGACNSPVSSVNITVTVMQYLAPSVSITVDPTTPVWENLLVTFTATTTNAGPKPKYQWKRNGQNVQGATGKTWGATTLKNNDIIRCEIISDYECPQPATAVSNDITVSVLTTVEHAANTNNLSLYPNPNIGNFTLTGSLFKGKEIQLEIINSIGQVVYKDLVQPVNGNIKKEIMLGNIANGIYLLRMNSESEQTNTRFRINR